MTPSIIWILFSYAVILFGEFPSQSHPTIAESRKREYEISLEKNFVNRQVTINLYTDSIKTDSLIFTNVDLRVDRLSNFGNTWWYYIFSENTSCLPTIEDKFQVIFKPQNGKLSIALFMDYQWTRLKVESEQRFKNDSEKISPSFIKINDMYDSFCQLDLDSNFFEGNYLIREIIFSHNAYDSLYRKGSTNRYKLKYSKVKNIFYNSSIILDDTCIFHLTENELIKKKLNNEKVLMIKFYNKRSRYVYYEGKWYSFFLNNFTSMDLFNTCPP